MKSNQSNHVFLLPGRFPVANRWSGHIALLVPERGAKSTLPSGPKMRQSQMPRHRRQPLQNKWARLRIGQAASGLMPGSFAFEDSAAT
jgi:hypothetical protein